MRELGVMGRGEFMDLSTSPAFDFLRDAAEDVYTASDGKPSHDQG
jgi:hypothetical protein